MSSVLRPTPNLEDQVPVLMSLSDKVAKLYPQEPFHRLILWRYSNPPPWGEARYITFPN
jgi:hypothetical protein